MSPSLSTGGEISGWKGLNIWAGERGRPAELGAFCVFPTLYEQHANEMQSTRQMSPYDLEWNPSDTFGNWVADSRVWPQTQTTAPHDHTVSLAFG